MGRISEPRAPSAPPSVEDVILRLEAASEGSRELDADIWLVVTKEADPEQAIAAARVELGREPGDAFKGMIRDSHAHALANPPRYTTSLDTALPLVDGDWSVVRRTRHPYRGAFPYEAIAWNTKSQGFAPTAPLAVCIAALKARRSIS